jgi:hypothetical protein
MTKSEYKTMSEEQKKNMREKRERERVNRINAELDSHKMAYHVKDREGNTFIYAGTAPGNFPLYRNQRGEQKHIFDMLSLTVIQQYAQ